MTQSVGFGASDAWSDVAPVGGRRIYIYTPKNYRCNPRTRLLRVYSTQLDPTWTGGVPRFRLRRNCRFGQASAARTSQTAKRESPPPSCGNDVRVRHQARTHTRRHPRPTALDRARRCGECGGVEPLGLEVVQRAKGWQHVATRDRLSRVPRSLAGCALRPPLEAAELRRAPRRAPLPTARCVWIR